MARSAPSSEKRSSIRRPVKQERKPIARPSITGVAKRNVAKYEQSPTGLLRALVSGNDQLRWQEIGKAIDLDEAGARKTLENLAEEAERSHDSRLAARVGIARSYVELTPEEQLQDRISDLESRLQKTDKGAAHAKAREELQNELTVLRHRYEQVKPAKSVPPQKEADPILPTNDSMPPSPELNAAFARIDRELDQLRLMISKESPVEQPQKRRDRVAELRREVLSLTTNKAALYHPRYDAILDELHELDLATANVEREELADLRSRLDRANYAYENNKEEDDFGGNAHPYREEALARRVNAAEARMQKGYDASEAAALPDYQEVKQNIQALRSKLEQRRVSPAIEAKAVVPARREEVLVSEAPPAQRTAPKSAHFKGLLSADISHAEQRLEAEAQVELQLIRRQALLKKHEGATPDAADAHRVNSTLVESGKNLEHALTREYLLLTENPDEMAAELDRQREQYERLQSDPIGKEVLSKVQEMERAGHVFNLKTAKEIEDADERAYALKLLAYRNSHRILEESLDHLRKYHEARLNLYTLRDDLVSHCKTCFIPKETREALEAAVTPSDRRNIVDDILKDPRKMDQPAKGLIPFGKYLLWQGVFAFNRMLGGVLTSREYANPDLDRLVKRLSLEQNAIDTLNLRRSDIADHSPAKNRVAEPKKTVDTYSLDDVLDEDRSDEGEDLLKELSAIAERADKLTQDLKGRTDTLEESEFDRLSSRYLGLQEDLEDRRSVPAEAKSSLAMVEEKIRDAELAFHALKRKNPAPVENLSPARPSFERRDEVLSHAESEQLFTLEQNVEALLLDVDHKLLGGGFLSEHDFQDFDQRSILLGKQLERLRRFSEEPAYKDASRLFKDLNTTLDEYEAKHTREELYRKKLPAEILVENAVSQGLRHLVSDRPKRAVLDQALSELNHGVAVRSEHVEEVTNVLFACIRSYPLLRPAEQRVVAEQFDQVVECLELGTVYQDLGVASLDGLARKLALPAPAEPASSDLYEAANDNDVTGPRPVQRAPAQAPAPAQRAAAESADDEEDNLDDLFGMNNAA